MKKDPITAQVELDKLKELKEYLQKPIYVEYSPNTDEMHKNFYRTYRTKMEVAVSSIQLMIP
jgi:hypothetical protein